MLTERRRRHSRTAAGAIDTYRVSHHREIRRDSGLHQSALDGDFFIQRLGDGPYPPTGHPYGLQPLDPYFGGAFCQALLDERFELITAFDATRIRAEALIVCEPLQLRRLAEPPPQRIARDADYDRTIGRVKRTIRHQARM